MTTYAESGYQLETVAADGSTLELLENDGAEYRFDTLAVDATFGNPVPITEVISSLMTDGGLTTIKSWGNRIAVFQHTIKGSDAGVLNAGEAALMSALDSIVALAWHAPFAAVSFFDVVACWSEFLFDDWSEVQQGTRTFRVSFECLPFARSENETTIEWTGVGTELDPLTSLTGWTVVSGTTPTISGGIVTTGSTVLRKTVTAGEYLWLKVTAGTAASLDVTGVSVDGTAIPDARIRREVVDAEHFYTIPTGAWRGESVVVEFTLQTSSGSTSPTLAEFWSRDYPGEASAATDTTPLGIGVIDVGGSARTPCTIRFTAPAGGAFVYTAPDPNTMVRSGSGETVFSKFTVASADGAEIDVDGRLMWFPQGDHATHIGFTDPQPTELYPDGIWPEEATGYDAVDDASRWAYPTDGRASISFFNTSGDKALISPRPTLPTGYSGDAIAYEVHALYPGRCGAGVFDLNGEAVPATYTYYKRWKHHAAE